MSRSEATEAKSEAPAETPEGLTKKAWTAFESLKAKHGDLAGVAKALRESKYEKGVSKPGFVYFVVSQIREHKRLERAAVAQSLAAEFEWQATSAQSHVSISQSLLTYLKLIRIEGSELVWMEE